MAEFQEGLGAEQLKAGLKGSRDVIEYGPHNKGEKVPWPKGPKPIQLTMPKRIPELELAIGLNPSGETGRPHQPKPDSSSDGQDEMVGPFGVIFNPSPEVVVNYPHTSNKNYNEF